MSDAIETLTRREAEILRLLLNGHEAKSAANELGISVHTINDHLRSARQKLGVSSSREAARLLGEVENAPPENDGSKPIGMEEGVSAGASVGTASIRRKGRAGGPVLIAGAIAMLTLIAAIALITSNASEDSAALADHPEDSEVVAGTTSENEGRAREWVALVDSKNWRASWQKSSPYFRSQIDADGWISTIQPLREPMGVVQSRVLSRVTKAQSLPGVPDGNYEILEFDTEFANRPNTVETVVMALDDGEWGVVGYFMR